MFEDEGLFGEEADLGPAPFHDATELEMDPPLLTEEQQSRVFSGSALNNFDYNLNSPLIADHPESLLRAAQGLTPKKRYLKNRIFADKVASIGLVPHSFLHYRASEGFHAWAAKYVYQFPVQSRCFQKIFDLEHYDAECAMTVALDFWKALTGSRVCTEQEALRREFFMRPSSSPVITRMQEDGEAFWFFYVLILMMNSSTTKERESLVESTRDWDVHLLKGDTDQIFLFEGQHPDWGSFQVGPGLVILPDHRRLLDRNMVLMLKDTMIARFTSKLSQLFHPREGFKLELVSKMTTLYEEGDKILRCRDNKFFDVVQLLEPYCNQRLSDLAWQFRPRIPRDTKFSLFLEEETKALELHGEGSIVKFLRLVQHETDWKVVLVYYGLFRHWGHPFIDYLEGLKKLYHQVTLPKKIDTEYANALASDLAYIVLKHEFDRQKRWFVDHSLLDPKHILYQHIVDCTWPTPGVIEEMADQWHRLPLIQCYEIPSSIDPSVLLADKSHSPNRKEVEIAISTKADGPIPSKKVLQTALRTPQRNTRDFLSSVNDVGLPRDALVIGLKGKEREVKRNGRFFALMSWDLREYFVSTEYLIKTFYVPLFQGLTMADDLKSVTKKILNCVIGQGLEDYTSITFANHLDYEKWNNHQRKEATDPVFKVMGQFLGLPDLFTRTHEFFQKSLIYYGDRPDLMKVVDGRVESKPGYRVAWEGQDGGLEGLRQKGWSVLNLLVILREASVRNTQVQTLAQGDNQVICTQYKLPGGLLDSHLDAELNHVFANNAAIMNAIHTGTLKLGLIINQKETLISSDYLTYSKIPVFRGCLQAHEPKRYSRVTCIPNDQIPSIGNSISTVSTSALTVAQFSSSILPPIIAYVLFGYLVLRLHMFHSPLLKGPLFPFLENLSTYFVLRGLFLDPVLGGISGTSLTRFLIRQFPDPVTESLTFWRMLYKHGTRREIRELALTAGEPPVKRSESKDLSKLLEKPVSLNLPKGLSAATLVKGEVRNWLRNTRASIVNEVVSEAVGFIETEEAMLRTYLLSVKPLFPRFLSEFAAGSFIGLTESIVGLFQNSRTIRMAFSSRFRREISDLLIKSELIACTILGRRPFVRNLSIWSCSAAKADSLRMKSWGSRTYGTTVPHPAEMVGQPTTGGALCRDCSLPFPTGEHLTVCFPGGIDLSCSRKGLLSPYLGSNTSESTSLFQPWEKDIKLPLIERALKLRVAIHWFVDPGTSVSRAIMQNLHSLTGLDWEESNLEFSRTGSALHRFYSSRQSNGGFSAVNPTGLSWAVVTADTMPKIGMDNYDFMYQSLMLYGQTVSLEINQNIAGLQPRHHYHIRCEGCLRAIEEIKLASDMELRLPDRSASVCRLSGGIQPSFLRIEGVQLKQGDWESLDAFDKSFHIGVAAGTNYAILLSDGDQSRSRAIMFPTSLARKLIPEPFLMGVLQGLLMGASYEVVYRRLVMWKREPGKALMGCCYHLINCLTQEESFISMTGLRHFQEVLLRLCHRVPPSYPASSKDLGLLVKSFLDNHLLQKANNRPAWRSKGQRLWIFSDFRTPRMTGLFILSHRLWGILRHHKVSTSSIDEIRAIKDLITYYASRDRLSALPSQLMRPFVPASVLGASDVVWCGREVRHAGARLLPVEMGNEPETSAWSTEYAPLTTWTELNFSTLQEPLQNCVLVPRLIDPLISGLRVVQLATGAHFKLRGILTKFPIARDGLIGGDGSGGMTAAFLRYYPESRAVFNSLFMVKDRQLRGVAPGEPSALAAMPASVRQRCVNKDSAWKEPSDLCSLETWHHFLDLKRRYGLDFSHLIFDMEVVSETDMGQIVNHLVKFLPLLLSPTGVLIFKMYGTREVQSGGKDLQLLGSLFHRTYGVTTGLTSSFSSEFYLVCVRLIQGKIMAKNVTLMSFRRLVTSLHAVRDPEAEFKRALKVFPALLMEGVPPELFPDPILDLIGLITHLGLESGVSIKYSSVVTAHRNNPGIPVACLVMLGLTLLSNAVLPLTKWFESGYAPPSDQRLIKLIGGFIGCWEFISWFYADFRIRVRLSAFMGGHVMWSYREVIRSSPKGPKPGLEWDFFEDRWRHKVLSKPFEPSVAGQVIRILARIWPRRDRVVYPTWKIYKDFLLAHFPMFNRGLHPLDTLMHSGLWIPGYGTRQVREAMWIRNLEEMYEKEVPEPPLTVDVAWDD
nr:MAG: RNA-dependent RNA polymerase [Rhabdoviridae sp.]